MALYFKKIKPAGISKMSDKVSKKIKDTPKKSVSLKKIKVIKDKNLKPINFEKMTKVVKLPKAVKIKIIKKVIKANKNEGF